MEGERVDVTDYFRERGWHGVMKAERCGSNVLVLFDVGPGHLTKAFDGRPRRFELVYRWLSSPSAELSQVQGSEVTHFGHRDVRGWKSKSLFDMFNLF